jgi:hypothetical protein
MPGSAAAACGAMSRMASIWRSRASRMAYHHHMRAWLILAIAGCQFSADPVAGSDGSPPPGAYRISGHAGTVGVSGTMPLSGVQVDALSDPSATTPTASAVTGSDGGYEIAVPGGYVAVLRAQATGYYDTYLYPTAALATDASALDTVLFQSETFSLLSSLVSVTQDLSMGWIGVRVVDASGLPVGGAKIDANGVVRYNGASGLPIADGTETAVDGQAYVFNTPVGPLQIGISVVGTPFASRSIPMRAQSVTLAFIGPGQQP